MFVSFHSVSARVIKKWHFYAVEWFQTSTQAPSCWFKGIKKFGPGHFACPLTDCQKVFKTYGNCKRHLLTHSGVTPYKCPLCPYASGQKSNLNRHMQVHSSQWNKTLGNSLFGFLLCFNSWWHKMQRCASLEEKLLLIWAKHKAEEFLIVIERKI